MKKSIFFYLLFLIALSACRKDKDDVTTTEEPYVPPIVNWVPETKIVNSSLTGFVADESGQPIADAAVKVGNLTATTDTYGHFFLKNVQLDAKGTVVRVQKPGYFDGSRRFFAVENETNRVKVEMLAKSFDHNFDAAAGGLVQTAEGATISFQPNSIKKADGTAYSGEVMVAVKWLDPSKVSTLDRMPGNLQGIDREAEQVALATYGMMAVELESPAGEALNLSAGKTATLTMPVPASMQANAPSEIPLWSYNEQHGVWVEEEFKATLTNGKYVGEVTHFSFWNCDYPYPLVELTASLIDQNGQPLSNYLVGIFIVNSFGATGYTSPDGTINGLIPANEDLELQVFGQCGTVIFSQNIGPYSNDTDLGTITVPISGLNQVNVSGTLVDCSNNPVQNGLVIIEFDGITVHEYVGNGAFDVSFSTCANTSEVILTGVDLNALEQSVPVNIPVNGTSNAGQISVCGVQLENFITLTVNDGTTTITKVYVPAQVYVDSVNGPGGLGTSIHHYSTNNPGTITSNLYFSFFGQSAGDYSSSNSVGIIQDNEEGWILGQSQSFSSFVVSEYGDLGEPVIGTFSGTLTNTAVQPPVSVIVTGSFNIKR